MTPPEHGLWSIYRTLAATVPDRPAIRSGGHSLSHGRLADRAVRLANVFAAHGIGRTAERADLAPWEAGQDLVGTYLLNGPEYMEVTLAGYAARAAPFNVNHRYVADELAHLLRDAEPAALVYHARFVAQVADVLPRLPRRPLLVQVADGTDSPLLEGALDHEAAIASAAGDLVVDGHSPDDLYVVYTGGTTGMPKGTLWRQADIWTAALGGDELPYPTVDEIVAHVVAGRPHRFAPIAPFMHAAAHWFGLRTLLSGGTVVLGDVVDHLDPADVWRTIQTEEVDGMLVVGEAIARPLLDEIERVDWDASSVRLIVVGGAATSVETKRRILAAMPKATILDAAGASETGSALRALATTSSLGEDGLFVPGDGIAVLDEGLTRQEQPGHPDPGWLAKRGAIPLGYLGDEAKTRRTFPLVDGVRWSVPGDRARLRADGLVQLLGRDSATINTGGEKVFAEEVEAALLRHPSVADAVVVGRPSERWGQEVVAVASRRGDDAVDDRDLIAFLGGSLARYKLPKQIVWVDEVVRSPVGKADYPWARRLVAAAAGADAG